MTGISGAIVWLIIAVVLFLIEGATVQMLCVWFACGAVVAMLSSFLGAPLWLQLGLFLITSAAVLAFARPILKKKLAVKIEATNADRVVGMIGLVTETIDNIGETGRVSANGLHWTARSEDGRIIEGGTQVLVKQIDGVKLIVQPNE